MPSGPKKRKSAKKKKEIEETFKNVPDIQEDCSNVESIPESTKDSVLTTGQKDEERDYLDSEKNISSQDSVPDDSNIAVPEEVSEAGFKEAEISKVLTQTEEKKEEEDDEVFLSENSEQIERFKPIFIQELQGIMKDVEGLKGTVIQQLQAIEKVTKVILKIVDDFNNFQVNDARVI